jgi:hypothetical protein
MIAFENDWDIIDRLVKKVGHRSYAYAYAVLRGGALFHHQETQPFKACLELAEELRDQPDIVRRLIHHGNWRNYVIGNVVAVLNRDSRYERDYLEKLTTEGGPFPAPLAAGWLTINTGATVPAMEAYLVEMGKRSDISHDTIPYSTVMVIYAALRLLRREVVSEFEKTRLFEALRSSSYFDYEVDKTESCYTSYQLYPPVNAYSS